MKLADLDRLESFALLGPGFAGGRQNLLTGLRLVGDQTARCRLVYAPFERPGTLAFRFDADEVLEVSVETGECPAAGRVALDAGEYVRAVETIREAIAAGDVYQVCHTVRATVRGVRGDGLVATMMRGGIPRFLAWVRLPWGEEFVSASPELFFETLGRTVRTEPMKGTARRDAAGALDASEKDRAELAMITDLLRNDLTKVCRPRSVHVACARRLLALPYAVQTVSEIVGELEDGVTLHDVLAALHPGGSVTGAPKAAALQMIGRLEPGPRGAYCGALGLVDGDNARFSLLIRTAVRTGLDTWVYGVGGGIVYDSDAATEREELEIKLGALSWPTRS